MKYKILLAINWKVVFLILRTFAIINYLSKMSLKGGYLPFCKSKSDWNKKSYVWIRLNVPNFPYFTKKITQNPNKIQKTAKKLHFLE